MDNCVHYFVIHLLWITVCIYYTEDALLKVKEHMKCALVQLALAKQHKEHCTFVYKLKLVDTCVYITAAIPYFRDIISSGHNVRVKKKI